MSIYAHTSKNYIEGSNQSILKRLEQSWREASPLWTQYMAEADVDTQMTAGNIDALYNAGARSFNTWNRGQFNFNLLRPAVSMISGHQIRTRKTSILVPQEPEDQVPADQLSSCLLWSMRKANSFNLISEAFESALITGMSLLSHWMDYSQDPVNGDIRCSVMKYSSFMIDPFFKKTDLSDCRFIWTRKWLSKSSVKLLLPGREDEIDSLPYDGNSDGRFPYLPEALNYQERNLIIYDEYWYTTTRTETVLLDQESGEVHKWRGDKDSLDLFLLQFPQVKKIKKEVPTINYGVVVQNRPMIDGPNPWGIDRYPFSPFLCYFSPEIPYMPQKIQGIIRNARDAQWAYSRRAKLELDYLEAGIQRGYIYPEDVPVNPDNLYEQGNGVNIPIKVGADPNQLKEIPPPQIPPSWFQQKEVLQQDLQKILGPTEELMGTADDGKVGILEVLKQGAGLTRLMPIFNRLDDAQSNSAQIFIDLMQANWEAGKFKRILNQDPHPYITNKYFSKFDIAIVDGTLTPTQQWMEFQQLISLMKDGILPNDSATLSVLLKAAPLQNKQDLIEAQEKMMQQQAQQQQQQQEIEQATIQAQLRAAEATAIANEGLGLERISRVKENQALAEERRAEAIKDLNQGALDQMRAVKELQGIDIANLEKFLNIVRSLKKESVQEVKEAGQQLDLPKPPPGLSGI